MHQIAGGKPARALNELQSQAGKLQETLVSLEDELEKADLPKQVIHGDYGPYNLLFKHNKIIAVLDFELARLDWRITDLVYALPRFAETRLGFNFNKVNCLIDAYRSEYELENDELRLIPRIWEYFRIKRSVVCWSRYYETQESYWLDNALENLQRAEIMVKNETHFLNQLNYA
jgi:Ser/Thr protein kinase RdoA (MazF antagonist)